ncbi:hypothetical protein BpHYR1_005368 [Brachionus plicatilis]|uniref:Uncharacterized protein n=1 Tax=Brachionus plicatilis TaxID=10195 RepID=A0A3M7RFN9_BRAPC|nr:hypothetical protein BpHYR1_005368 [Brachionus plicatilis]
MNKSKRFTYSFFRIQFHIYLFQLNQIRCQRDKTNFNFFQGGHMLFLPFQARNKIKQIIHRTND